MFALLALVVATLLSAPTVQLVITQHAGPLNIHTHYVVTGPYEGRVCLDVDDTEKQHVAAMCSDHEVSVKAGEVAVVDEDVHGPVGKWVVMAVLPDTLGDDDAITSTPQELNIEATLSAAR